MLIQSRSKMAYVKTPPSLIMGSTIFQYYFKYDLLFLTQRKMFGFFRNQSLDYLILDSGFD